MTCQSLEFRCYSCRMTLNMPVAMEEITIANLRKFFKWADQEYWRNEDSTRLFFSYIPEIVEELKSEWDQASLTFQKEYQDPKFKNGNYINDKEERERRRNHNKRLMSKVKAAKARYERFQKRVPKLEELKSQYVK